MAYSTSRKFYIGLLLCMVLIVMAMGLLYGGVILELPNTFLHLEPFIYLLALLIISCFCSIKLFSVKLE